jgi:CotS family spore coat protein
MIYPEGVNQDQKIITLYEQCQKHTKELKKIRNFMRNRGQKSEFENYYLENFFSFFDRAVEITEELQKQDDEQIYEDVLRKGIFCHGDYNYHNILMGEDVFTINFEHYSNDTHVKDLANICRKIGEKNNWNIEMGHVMLDSYQKQYPLSKSEWKNLYYRLAYPEKFWKISNYYFNHSKAWIPDKNKEKLTNLITNEEKRILFLKELF